MEKKSLQFKLVAGLALFGAFATVSAGTVLFLQREVSVEYQKISSDQFPKVKVAQAMLAEFRRVRIDVRSIPIVGNSPEDRARHLEEAKQAIGRFLEIKERLDNHSFTPEAEALIERISATWTIFLNFGLELAGLMEEGGPENLAVMFERIRVECPVKASAVVTAIESFLSYQQDRFDEVIVAAERKKTVAFFSAATLCMLLLLTMISTGYLFARRISSRIETIADDLVISSRAVKVSGGDLSSTSEKLKSSSESNSAFVSSTVTSIKDINASVQSDADSARESSDIASQTLEEARSGHEKLESLKYAMGEVEASKSVIEGQLGSQEADLGTIQTLIDSIAERTKVINEIVFQTKLLSFNASVEAARAGEAGKGFAVVAEEVGNLAKMSGEASEAISSLLEDSKAQVEKIAADSKERFTGALQQTSDSVQAGSKATQDCIQSFEAVLTNVRKLNDLAQKVNAASQKQSSELSDVTRSMRSIEEDAESSTRTAAALADSGHRLEDHSERLEKLACNLNTLIHGEEHLVEAESSEVRGVVEVMKSTEVESRSKKAA